MKKLYKDILELKTWIRITEGAKGEGKGQFGTIHSEKQLMDLIYKFNKEKNKEINILWFNQDVNIIENRVFSTSKVVITNGEEVIEETMTGLGEEKRSDISFGLGKALTYGKRFWLQKFLDLSSDDIEPDNIDYKESTPTKKYTTKTYVFKATEKQISFGKTLGLTEEEMNKATTFNDFQNLLTNAKNNKDKAEVKETKKVEPTKEEEVPWELDL